MKPELKGTYECALHWSMMTRLPKLKAIIQQNSILYDPNILKKLVFFLITHNASRTDLLLK